MITKSSLLAHFASENWSRQMIEASGLSKRYGATLAVDGLSFAVPPGQVTGFLGPNGAGKSTTMRLILGLDAPSSGSVTVSGRPYAAFRRPLLEVGAMLEAKAFHGGRTAPNPPPCPAPPHGGTPPPPPPGLCPWSAG